MADEKLFESFKKFLEEGCDSSTVAGCDVFDINAIFKVVAHGDKLFSRMTYGQFLKGCPIGEFRSVSQFLDRCLILVYTILHTEWPHAIPFAIVEILETLANKLNIQDTISNLSSVDYERVVKIVLVTEPYLSGPNFLLEAPVHVRGVQLLKLLKVFEILSKRTDLLTESAILPLRQLVQRDGRDLDGRSLLLLACDLLSPIYTRSLVPFLLFLGASPYSRDVGGNDVFHLLAITGTEYWHHDVLRDEIACQLLDFTHGHGLDMINEEGMNRTP